MSEFLRSLKQTTWAWVQTSALTKLNLRKFGCGMNSRFETTPIPKPLATAIQTASRLPISITGLIVTPVFFKAFSKARRVVEPGSRKMTS